MHTEEFVFEGSQGSLSGRLVTPGYPVEHSVVFAHCFTCSKDIPAAKRITAKLAARGLAVLSFDFTGLGHSDGEFENTSFTSNVDDLKHAAKELQRRIAPPSLLVGHSLGGAAVIAAAPDIPTIKAIATIGAPFDPAHVTHLFSDSLNDISASGQAEVTLGGRPFTITQDFVDDIHSSRLVPALAKLDAAVLVLHSPIDGIVDVSNAADIFQHAKHPKSFVSLDDADHLMRRVSDADYAAGVIAAWAAKYLPSSATGQSDMAPDGDVLVSEVEPNGFSQDIVVGRTHQLRSDEPADIGGTNTGPTPYQLLQAGLGACTTMTIRMYARRKNIPLDHVSVTVTHDKRHLTECKRCESTPHKVDHFIRSIQLTGELSDEHKVSLLNIAEKCPVHRTLEASAHIETTLKKGE
jgi:uncharacterized OsmC-like protein/alpha-beta hydrolase superfamily lysophospholipase